VWHLSRRYGPRTSFSARLASRAKANAGGSQTLFADQVGICSDQVTDRTGGEQRRAPDELFNDGLKRSLPMRSRAATKPDSAPRPAASSNETD
jgi:hypothetical protein